MSFLRFLALVACKMLVKLTPNLDWVRFDPKAELPHDINALVYCNAIHFVFKEITMVSEPLVVTSDITLKTHRNAVNA